MDHHLSNSSNSEASYFNPSTKARENQADPVGKRELDRDNKGAENSDVFITRTSNYRNRGNSAIKEINEEHEEEPDEKQRGEKQHDEENIFKESTQRSIKPWKILLTEAESESRPMEQQYNRAHTSGENNAASRKNQKEDDLVDQQLQAFKGKRTEPEEDDYFINSDPIQHPLESHLQAAEEKPIKERDYTVSRVKRQRDADLEFYERCDFHDYDVMIEPQNYELILVTGANPVAAEIESDDEEINKFDYDELEKQINPLNDAAEEPIEVNRGEEKSLEPEEQDKEKLEEPIEEQKEEPLLQEEEKEPIQEEEEKEDQQEEPAAEEIYEEDFDPEEQDKNEEFKPEVEETLLPEANTIGFDEPAVEEIPPELPPKKALFIDMAVRNLDPRVVRLTFIYRGLNEKKLNKKQRLLVGQRATKEAVAVSTSELLSPDFKKKVFSKEEMHKASTLIPELENSTFVEQDSKIAYISVQRANSCSTLPELKKVKVPKMQISNTQYRNLLKEQRQEIPLRRKNLRPESTEKDIVVIEKEWLYDFPPKLKIAPAAWKRSQSLSAIEINEYIKNRYARKPEIKPKTDTGSKTRWKSPARSSVDFIRFNKDIVKHLSQQNEGEMHTSRSFQSRKMPGSPYSTNMILKTFLLSGNQTPVKKEYDESFMASMKTSERLPLIKSNRSIASLPFQSNEKKKVNKKITRAVGNRIERRSQSIEAGMRSTEDSTINNQSLLLSPEKLREMQILEAVFNARMNKDSVESLPADAQFYLAKHYGQETKTPIKALKSHRGAVKSSQADYLAMRTPVPRHVQLPSLSNLIQSQSATSSPIKSSRK